MMDIAPRDRLVTLPEGVPELTLGIFPLGTIKGMEIYAVIDNDRTIRYIGKYGSARKRVWQHWQWKDRVNSCGKPFNDWLRSLEGPPEYVILAIASKHDAGKIEKDAIIAYRKAFPGNLLNIRPRPPVDSPEHALWDDYIQRQRDSHIGQVCTEETKRKMRKAAKNRPPISEETRRRMSAARSRWWEGR